MSEPEVLFLIEHVARELDVVACLVAKLRTDFGISAAVRNYYDGFNENLTLVGPRVVVFPFFYGADHIYPIEYSRAWPNARLINLGWEQILNQVDLGMKIPRDDFTRNEVFHVCWTYKHRDFLAAHGVLAERLLLTGNPVMKLYEEPYSKYFKSRRNLAGLYGIDEKKKWVLFPEAYQFAFFSEDVLQILVDKQNADIRLMRQAKEYSERSFRNLLLWVNELSGDDPLFILRPRPSTTEDAAQEFVRETLTEVSPNLKIIKAESVRDWILAADHVISSHSTTLVEAALAAKPVHRFSPEAYPDALTLSWHGLVPLLDSREALLAAIRSTGLQEIGRDVAEWARAEFLWTRDPLDAIAQAIGDLLASVPQQLPAGGKPVVQTSRSGDALPEDIFEESDVAARVSRWASVLEAHRSAMG